MHDLLCQRSHNMTFLRALNLSQSRILFVKVYNFDTLWSVPSLDKFMILTNDIAELTPVEQRCSSIFLSVVFQCKQGFKKVKRDTSTPLINLCILNSFNLTLPVVATSSASCRLLTSSRARLRSSCPSFRSFRACTSSRLSLLSSFS